MTEAEWLASESPRELLFHTRRKASLRKFRLYCCACCRRIWPRIPEPWRHLVELSERYAEGGVRARDLAVAAGRLLYPDPPRPAIRAAWCASAPGYNLRALVLCDDMGSCAAVAATGDDFRSGYPPAPVELAFQSRLIRDVFTRQGARRIHLNPVWRTSIVAALAEVAYEGRALPEGELTPQRLSTLADALEDAGCADADLLGHLRSSGTHVRGCWALDLVLGKS